ncbi:Homocysteine S-methyltransferase [Mycena filopes]|nr:Homocysteine S-methyltransferase [Mycena filopes]
MLSPRPLYSHSAAESDTVVLDGGLGTTLETTFGLDLSHTPLWSAKAVIEHPEVIVDAHLAFLRAGARIILTSTYQCSQSTFEKAGYSFTDTRQIMSKCVQLAVEARSRFTDERKRAADSVPDEPDKHGLIKLKIALSLGPFGAGLTPAQEFDGYYPPPFGPRGYTHGGDNRNAFDPTEEREEEEDATRALARFHLERLRIFAEDQAAWAALDFLAFETVPLLREIRAVRMAIAALESEGFEGKPWWISFVFPDGRFPETTAKGNAHVDVRSVVAAALQNPTPGSAAEFLPIPSALGINCTDADVISPILVDMESALEELWDPQNSFRPWLVLYPNGGDTYDTLAQAWVVRESGGIWAEKVADIVAGTKSRMQHRDIWAGVVAGGCCRTGPEDIRLLSQLHRQSFHKRSVEH